MFSIERVKHSLLLDEKSRVCRRIANNDRLRAVNVARFVLPRRRRCRRRCLTVASQVRYTDRVCSFSVSSVSLSSLSGAH